MNKTLQDFSFKLNQLNVFEKIIAINIVVYIVGFLLQLVLGSKGYSGMSWFELPKDVADFIVQPWSIFTYGFLHYGFMHVFFNLLVLHYISVIALNLFNTKMVLNIYFMGILAGGILYLFVYNVFGEFMLKQVGSLVGASAGIRSLLIFLCVYMPNKELRLLIFNIKLKYIGIVLIVIDVLGLFSLNQGGYVAHMGGTLLGCFYAYQLRRGFDIGKGFERFLGWITALFKPRSPLKKVYKNKSKSFAGHNKNEFNEFTKQKRIDLILDKISKSGYDSLTKEEKEFLFKAGKD
ncbi:rhomboid family intramembrane serine protease [Geojedonia litorea]|uniref:Rhomboid family intramembrane serine protease n=1 Tax=Geojedonia litorea TaxID=1268269 RepID=A0ABV9N979_9FLAO